MSSGPAAAGGVLQADADGPANGDMGPVAFCDADCKVVQRARVRRGWQFVIILSSVALYGVLRFELG